MADREKLRERCIETLGGVDRRKEVCVIFTVFHRTYNMGSTVKLAITRCSIEYLKLINLVL